MIPFVFPSSTKGNEGKVWGNVGVWEKWKMFCKKSIRIWDNYWKCRKLLLSLRCPFKGIHTPEGYSLLLYAAKQFIHFREAIRVDGSESIGSP